MHWELMKRRNNSEEVQNVMHDVFGDEVLGYIEPPSDKNMMTHLQIVKPASLMVTHL